MTKLDTFVQKRFVQYSSLGDGIADCLFDRRILGIFYGYWLVLAGGNREVIIVGAIEGINDGVLEGNRVGIADGLFDGIILGIFDGYWLGLTLVNLEEIVDGILEGNRVGIADGLFD